LQEQKAFFREQMEAQSRGRRSSTSLITSTWTEPEPAKAPGPGSPPGGMGTVSQHDMGSNRHGWALARRRRRHAPRNQPSRLAAGRQMLGVLQGPKQCNPRLRHFQVKPP
jgi:hypothetical protein